MNVSNLKERLCCAFRWKEIKRLLAAIFVISLFLSLFFVSENPENWLSQIVSSFIFTFFIAFSIYVVLNLADTSRIKSRALKFITIGVLITIGGWIGTALSIAFCLMVFGISINIKLSWMISNTILSLFFGAVCYGYFVLRERLEKAAKKLAEKEVNEQRLLRLKTKAELEALRAKINPHFLFNTLNSIASLIPIDPEKAEAMVQKLSHLFRYALDASNQELMTVQHELDIAEEYLEIEKVRLGDRLCYKLSMDDDLRDFLIPGFLIQPLVENSVKHGIAPLKTGGEVEVQCIRENDYCRIEISDSGNGFTQKGNGKGFGLSAVRERLELYYGHKYHLNISNEAGVQIEIHIPLQSKKQKRKQKSRALQDNSNR